MAQPDEKQLTEEAVPEEEVLDGSWIRPDVEVKPVEVVTGEESEEVFWSHRAKLYRWFKPENQDSGAGEWKERGLGEAKLLRHKESRKIRFLLRQERTMKIVANHYVVKLDKYCDLVPNVSSDKIWVWTVNDYADGEPVLEQFALRFGQLDQASIFKVKFEEAAAINAEHFSTAPSTEETSTKEEAKDSETKKEEETKVEAKEDSPKESETKEEN